MRKFNIIEIMITYFRYYSIKTAKRKLEMETQTFGKRKPLDDPN